MSNDILKDHELVDIQHEGDNVIFTHVQDIDPTIAEIKQRARVQNEGGFSHDRNMRYIGSIPAGVIENNPALRFAFRSGDPEIMEKAIRIFFQSQEGQQFTVNKLDTGRSGKVIIK